MLALIKFSNDNINTSFSIRDRISSLLDFQQYSFSFTLKLKVWSHLLQSTTSWPSLLFSVTKYISLSNIIFIHTLFLNHQRNIIF